MGFCLELSLWALHQIYLHIMLKLWHETSCAGLSPGSTTVIPSWHSSWSCNGAEARLGLQLCKQISPLRMSAADLLPLTSPAQQRLCGSASGQVKASSMLTSAYWLIIKQKLLITPRLRLFICLLVCLQDYRKNYWTDSQRTWWWFDLSHNRTVNSCGSEWRDPGFICKTGCL